MIYHILETRHGDQMQAKRASMIGTAIPYLIQTSSAKYDSSIMSAASGSCSGVRQLFSLTCTCMTMHYRLDSMALIALHEGF